MRRCKIVEPTTPRKTHLHFYRALRIGAQALPPTDYTSRKVDQFVRLAAFEPLLMFGNAYASYCERALAGTLAPTPWSSYLYKEF